jgi:hypothetical protein
LRVWLYAMDYPDDLSILEAIKRKFPGKDTNGSRGLRFLKPKMLKQLEMYEFSLTRYGLG